MVMKNILIAVAVLLVVAGSAYYYFNNNATPSTYEKPVIPEIVKENTVPEEVATSSAVVEAPVPRGPQSIIGESVDGEPVTAYHFGTGTKEVLLIGGIHGGYSWNTALLSYELITWLEANPEVVPAELTVTIVPVLNPDGLKLVTGKNGRFTKADVTNTEATRIAGRFNKNDVDLNRNFDCAWQAEGKWQDRNVSGGSEALSEPESKAIASYVEKNTPDAVIVWYSAAGGVYSSNCKKGVSDKTAAMTKLYAEVSKYTAHEEFDYYEITGDLVNWLASENIPAISVLLTNHTDTELDKNKAGVKAILKYISE